MRQQIKRRRYPLINKSHQYRYIAFTLIYNLIIVAFLIISLFLPDFIQLQDEGLSWEIRAAAADKILAIHSRIWFAIIALICVIGLHSFRAFLRYVGPLYRLNRSFQYVRDGDLSLRVKLRKKDYLHLEAESFNRMLDTIEEKLKSSQMSAMQALNLLSELEQKVTKENSWGEKDKEPLYAIRKHIDKVIDTGRYFRIQEVG